MLFENERIMIYHPGKCGGTTIEHLFLQPLRQTNLAKLLREPCFRAENNCQLTPEWLDRRVRFMVGYLPRAFSVNGIWGIYLQHADIYSSLKIHGAESMNLHLKIAFVRNPFPRILSAFYYGMGDRKSTFREFVLDRLERKLHRNRPFTMGHFGEMHRFTHRDGKQFVDFLGRLEHIADDVPRLSEMVGIPLSLEGHRRHAKTVAGEIYEHYSEAYDEVMVDRVYDLYRKDFDLFGYHFERELPFRPRDRQIPQGASGTTSSQPKTHPNTRTAS